MARSPNVLTIPSDAAFLEVLAEAVLKGFPGETRPSPLDLARTTILVPTRRAARELHRIFFEVNGKSLLLPRVRPVGDIDEHLFEAQQFSAPSLAGAVPPAISPIGRDLILMDLIRDWAEENPQEKLAAEIVSSPKQVVILAASLAEFLDSFETEEIDHARLSELYGIEAARHREAILSFLGIVREKLPARLLKRQLLGPKARRSLLLRQEAAHLSENPPPWPVIAAGSTGSIPAARELLSVISRLPKGAVILPGLDTHMDEESWQELGAQHPQFILKQLLESMSLARSEVALMPGCAAGGRSWLASEIMRPTATSENWRSVVSEKGQSIGQAIENLEMVQASSVPEEAFTISLLLRKAFAEPRTTATLITPDRQLARRVKQELANRGIDIEDSAGEPLVRFGAAAFLDLLIDAIIGACAPEKLTALFKHDLCRLGFDRETARRAVNVIELSVFRAGFIAPILAELATAVTMAREAAKTEPHTHPAIKRIAAADWTAATDYARAAAACLSPLMEIGEQGLGAQLEALLRCCEVAAGSDLWNGQEAEALRSLLEELQSEAGTIPSCRFAAAGTLVQHYLRMTPFRTNPKRGRLSILGLLEARLSRPDVAILGGLNEGRWPAAPDAGPWLNRPMRAVLGLQQPERDIGQTAHDFAQALGCKEVYLTWSRRVGDAPATPSRWVLRLQMLIKAAGLEKCLGPRSEWQSLAARLDDAAHVTPCKPPKPTPPLAARPRQISVTRVETLIRDPYAFYANQILGLRPLEQISPIPSMAQRGMLMHGIIADLLQEYPRKLPPRPLEYLLERARHRFEPLLPHPDVATFWWPQFLRIADWLVANEPVQRRDIVSVYSEIEGRLEFMIASGPFALTCRADRIDLFTDECASIFDYKTGSVPSAKQVNAGLAPQLTLQSAMLENGAFAELGKRQTRGVYYVKLGSGSPPGEIHCPKLKVDCARETLSSLISLLNKYEMGEQPYLSRAMVETEDEERDFDHLSRYREWTLSGEAA